MQLKCEQCGAPFGIADVHLDRDIAVCAACGSVQRLPREPTRSGPNQLDAERSSKSSIVIPTPSGFTVEENGNELVIRQRWFQWGLFLLLFFAIAWDSFLFGWYSMFFGGGGPGGAFDVVFFIFPIGHVAVGFGVTYFVLAGFLNSTVIRVADGMLTIRHGPLPWLGNLDLPINGIEQIYCQKKLQKNRNSDGHGTSLRYEVFAIVGGQKTRLLGGLQEVDHALFVEQRLEKFLELADGPVPGEMTDT